MEIQPLPPNPLIEVQLLDVASLNASLTKIGFTQHELLQRLTDLARDPDPDISLKALSQLIALAKSAAALNRTRVRLTSTQSSTTNADGTTSVTHNLRTSAIINGLHAPIDRTTAILNEAARPVTNTSPSFS